MFYNNPKSFLFNHQKAALLGRMPFILLAQGFSPGINKELLGQYQIYLPFILLFFSLQFA